MLTPIVDSNWGDWEIVSTEGGWLLDYKASGWRAYCDSGWCRLEHMYCAHMPLKEDINDRIYKCQSALAHAMLANRRPHFLYGTKEKEEKRSPICLPLLPLDNPMTGFFSNENDKIIIEKLLLKLQPYIAQKSNMLRTGYVGEKNSNNLKHGKGKYIYKDGAVFSGEFRDDLRYNGVLVTSSGEEQFYLLYYYLLIILN